MTSVIGEHPAPAYAHLMPSTGRSMLEALLAEQRELEARIHELEANPRQILVAGEALLAFAAREDDSFAALAPLLDPAVRAELEAEHRQFTEDFELLDWLVRTTPDSPDVAVLVTSLLHRMRQHTERDGRLLVRASALHPGRDRACTKL
jgi:hypothetical protein